MTPQGASDPSAHKGAVSLRSVPTRGYGSNEDPMTVLGATARTQAPPTTHAARQEEVPHPVRTPAAEVAQQGGLTQLCLAT